MNDFDWNAGNRCTERRERRRERRLDKMAAGLLPDWAPSELRRMVRENLAATSGARRVVRYEDASDSHPDCIDPFCAHCQPTAHHLRVLAEERSTLIRLATYPDMRGAWATIMTKERRGPLAGKSWAVGANGDSLCYFLLTQFKHYLRGDYSHIPEQSASETKKSAAKITGLARKLIAAIDEHRDARAVTAGYLGAELAVKNLAFRAQNGETQPPIPADLPRRLWPTFTYEAAIERPTPCDLEDDADAVSTWDDLPVADRMRWLCAEVQAIDLRDLLASFADEIDYMATAPQRIARPGSGDPRVRILITELSDWMHAWYGSPLDEVVARFVSAILDLYPPLTRDDVRPTRKRGAGA